MAKNVTKRTKLDVAETLDELYRTTLATKGRSRDGYLLARGAEAALHVASGYARGGYDSPEYNDIAEMVSSLSTHLRAEKMNIDLYDDVRRAWHRPVGGEEGMITDNQDRMVTDNQDRTEAEEIATDTVASALEIMSYVPNSMMNHDSMGEVLFMLARVLRHPEILV